MSKSKTKREGVNEYSHGRYGFEIFPILYNTEKITEEIFSVPVEGMDGIVTVFAVKAGKQAEVITKREMDERGISAKELEKIAMEENCAYTLMPLNAVANDCENDSGAFIVFKAEYPPASKAVG